MNKLFVKKVCCLSSAFCRVSFRVFRKGYLFLAEDFQTWTFGSFVSRQKNIKSEKQSLFVDAVASTSSATNYSITRCLSLSKAHSQSSLWFRLRSITGIMFQPSVTEPMPEHRLKVCERSTRRHVLILIPVISTPLNHHPFFL